MALQQPTGLDIILFKGCVCCSSAWCLLNIGLRRGSAPAIYHQIQKDTLGVFDLLTKSLAVYKVITPLCPHSFLKPLPDKPGADAWEPYKEKRGIKGLKALWNGTGNAPGLRAFTLTCGQQLWLQLRCLTTTHNPRYQCSGYVVVRLPQWWLNIIRGVGVFCTCSISYFFPEWNSR